jgi:hypothetical protein
VFVWTENGDWRATLSIPETECLVCPESGSAFVYAGWRASNTEKSRTGVDKLRIMGLDFHAVHHLIAHQRIGLSKPTDEQSTKSNQLIRQPPSRSGTCGWRDLARVSSLSRVNQFNEGVAAVHRQLDVNVPLKTLVDFQANRVVRRGYTSYNAMPGKRPPIMIPRSTTAKRVCTIAKNQTVHAR